MAYIDLREDLMDAKVESDLLLIEEQANWQRCHDKMLEAETQLGIAYERLMAAVGNVRELKDWLWVYERRN